MMLTANESLLATFRRTIKGLVSGGSNNHRSDAKTTKRFGRSGEVFLIGAGPGDAELLTMKAHRLICEADVVLYDWLVNPDVLNLIPRHTKKVFVGKKCGRHSMQQQDICDLMVQYALDGARVVRLKGGDPAIFARAAEECVALEKHQIDYAIVPGITAASGASAYAGIPLTHRECAQSVRFVTAHFKDESHEPDWHSLATSANGKMGETLVFYMGLGRAGQIAERLIQHGVASDKPVAVVDQATDKAQTLLYATLEELSDKLAATNIKGPALIIVGDVVNKRYQVNANLLHAAVA